MKKVIAVLVAMVLVVALASVVFAADAKGTIKSVDTKAGTVVFCPEGGKDETLKADKAVLDKVKAGDKVDANVEHGMLMGVKGAAAAPAKKAPVGC